MSHPQLRPNPLALPRPSDADGCFFFFYFLILSCQESYWEKCFELLYFSGKARGKSCLNVQDTEFAAEWPFQVLNSQDSDPSVGSDP